MDFIKKKTFHFALDVGFSAADWSPGHSHLFPATDSSPHTHLKGEIKPPVWKLGWARPGVNPASGGNLAPPTPSPPGYQLTSTLLNASPAFHTRLLLLLVPFFFCMPVCGQKHSAKR